MGNVGDVPEVSPVNMTRLHIGRFTEILFAGCCPSAFFADTLDRIYNFAIFLEVLFNIFFLPVA